jgi:hypothetical protein
MASQHLMETAKDDLERSRMIWIQETWAERTQNHSPGVVLR